MKNEYDEKKMPTQDLLLMKPLEQRDGPSFDAFTLWDAIIRYFEFNN